MGQQVCAGLGCWKGTVLCIPAPPSYSMLGTTDLGLCSPWEHPNSAASEQVPEFQHLFLCSEGISLTCSLLYITSRVLEKYIIYFLFVERKEHVSGGKYS